MTRIEKFAQDKMGIILTKYQVDLIQAWGQGMIVNTPKLAGVSTAKKVMLAWIDHGLEIC